MTKNLSKSNEVRNLKLVLVVLVILQIIVIFSTAFFHKDANHSQSAATNSSSLFPFWLVVFIPIIASKKGRISIKDQKRGFWVLIGIAFLVLCAMSAFLLASLT